MHECSELRENVESDIETENIQVTFTQARASTRCGGRCAAKRHVGTMMVRTTDYADDAEPTEVSSDKEQRDDTCKTLIP